MISRKTMEKLAMAQREQKLALKSITVGSSASEAMQIDVYEIFADAKVKVYE
jgi:hypothetical protein